MLSQATDSSGLEPPTPICCLVLYKHLAAVRNLSNATIQKQGQVTTYRSYLAFATRSGKNVKLDFYTGRLMHLAEWPQVRNRNVWDSRRAVPVVSEFGVLLRQSSSPVIL